ncbi:MAG: ATP-binding protein [Nostoc sp.]
MTNQQELLSLFQSLIERQESEILDFKRDAYNLSEEDEKLALVKDIVCMYNTPRTEDAHIVIGVKEYTTSPKDVCGIDLSTTNPKHLDQSSMQSAFQLKGLEIEPFPSFRVETLQIAAAIFLGLSRLLYNLPSESQRIR